MTKREKFNELDLWYKEIASDKEYFDRKLKELDELKDTEDFSKDDYNYYLKKKVTTDFRLQLLDDNINAMFK